VLPHLTNVLDSLRKVSLPPTFQGLDKLKAWVTTVKDRPAHCELSIEECRQLQFDLDLCFKEFEDQIN